MQAAVPDVGAGVAVSPTPHTELRIPNDENKNDIITLQTFSPFLRAKLTAMATSSVVAGLTITSGLENDQLIPTDRDLLADLPADARPVVD